MYTYENQPIDELIHEICDNHPNLEQHLRRIEDYYDKEVADLIQEVDNLRGELARAEDEVEDERRVSESLEAELNDLQEEMDEAD